MYPRKFFHIARKKNSTNLNSPCWRPNWFLKLFIIQNETVRCYFWHFLLHSVRDKCESLRESSQIFSIMKPNVFLFSQQLIIVCWSLSKHSWVIDPNSCFEIKFAFSVCGDVCNVPRGFTVYFIFKKYAAQVLHSKLNCTTWILSWRREWENFLKQKMTVITYLVCVLRGMHYFNIIM